MASEAQREARRASGVRRRLGGAARRVAGRLSRARRRIADALDPRRDGEESLERSERFLSSLVENLPDMVFVKDARTLQFVRVNRAAEQLLGISREELVGKSDHDFFPKSEADFFTAKDRAVLDGGTMIDIPEEPIHTADRGLRLLHTKKIPILAPDGRPLYLLGLSEDITDKKRAEEERDRARHRIVELETERAVREQFVSTLSHDLRTPLSTVLVSAQLLAQSADRPDLVARLTGAIMRSASRADQMIQDLLDVTRVAAGHPLALKVAALDLATLAENAVADLRSLYPNRIDLEVEGVLEVHWSANEIRRALENLLSNAVKHGSRDGAVRVSIHPSGSDVSIAVHNEGAPITPADVDAIFEPFGRSSCSSATKGWGLGLPLVKAIAEAHGGRVRVRSSAAEGTSFELVLPRDARPFETPLEPSSVPPASHERA